MILTESDLRSRWHKGRPTVVKVPPGSVLTPAAKDFLSAHNIQLSFDGDDPADSQSQNGNRPTSLVKPEHMTHLYGKKLVEKTPVK